MAKIKINKNQLLPTFDYTITVLNKLKAIHSASKLDVWKKTILHNCFYSSKTVSNITGTTVAVGSNFICRVPKNAKYRPYNVWQKDLTGFTFNTGDYIFLGELEEEDITAKNIISIVNKYKPNVFEIKTFKDNTGAIELYEHYHLEGV